MNTDNMNLICAAAEQGTCNAILSGILPGNPTTTLTVPLSADGSAPATHYGCQFRGSDTLAAQVAQAEAPAPDGDGAPWIRYTWLLKSPNNLLSTNSATAQIGAAWSFAAACADQGLTQVAPALPGGSGS